MNGIPTGDLGRRVSAIALAWLSAVGFDFLWHAGLMHGFYLSSHPFLLAPDSAFARIPLGYAAFLLFAILLDWLMRRAGISGAGRGARFGLAFGLMCWGALCLALASITTASWKLLLGWFFGQSAEMALMGAVLGAGASGMPGGRLLSRVLFLVIVCLALGLLAQNVLPTGNF